MEKEREYIRDIKFGASGNVHYFRNWVIPFADEIIATVEVNNNQLLESNLDNSHSVKPKALNIDEQSIYVQVVLYMTTELGGWVMGKIYDAISNKITKAIKGKLTDTQFEGNCRVTVIYTDNMSITVEGPVQSKEDVDILEKAIPEAHRAAFTWQQSNKTTDRVLVYKIKDGLLSREMTL